MAKLWAIIKREYLERVRSKWFLIATFFGPIFFSAIIIVPAWMASKSKATSDVYNTTILDVTGTGFGHRLAPVKQPRLSQDHRARSTPPSSRSTPFTEGANIPRGFGGGKPPSAVCTKAWQSSASRKAMRRC